MLQKCCEDLQIGRVKVDPLDICHESCSHTPVHQNEGVTSTMTNQYVTVDMIATAKEPVDLSIRKLSKLLKSMALIL